jgi:hypothetical protein
MGIHQELPSKTPSAHHVSYFSFRIMQSYDSKLVSHAEDSLKELLLIFEHRVNIKHGEKYK